MGAPRQTATLYVGSGGDERSRRVPLEVGRRLAKAAEDGSPAFDRAPELDAAVGRLERSCALSRVASLVNRRDYATGEVRERLLRDGYPPEVVEAVVERSRELRLLDDARFAETFVRTKVSSGWGRARIARELERRGIDPQGALALCACDGESELARAREAAGRRSFHGRDPYAQCVRFLVGRGFAPGVAHEVARDLRAREPGDGAAW